MACRNTPSTKLWCLPSTYLDLGISAKSQLLSRTKTVSRKLVNLFCFLFSRSFVCSLIRLFVCLFVNKFMSFELVYWGRRPDFFFLSVIRSFLLSLARLFACSLAYLFPTAYQWPLIVTFIPFASVPLVGPVIISANYTSSTSINIRWNPVPESLRLGIITKYIFNLTDVLTGEVTTAVFDGANLHGEATNLSKYREYSITGAAVNSKGQSNFTSTVTCRTNEDGERKERTSLNLCFHGVKVIVWRKV